MTTITVDQETSKLLKEVRDAVELRDSEGTVIGHFAPKTYTLKEVYEHLLSISPDEERKAILRKRLVEMAREEACASR